MVHSVTCVGCKADIFDVHIINPSFGERLSGVGCNVGWPCVRRRRVDTSDVPDDVVSPQIIPVANDIMVHWGGGSLVAGVTGRIGHCQEVLTIYRLFIAARHKDSATIAVLAVLYPVSEVVSSLNSLLTCSQVWISIVITYYCWA